MSHFKIPNIPFTAVVFDCDGTLADTMPMHYQAWREGYRLSGAPFDLTWEEFYEFAGSSAEETIAIMNQRYSCALNPVEVSAHYVRVVERLHDEIDAIDEIVTFARECKAAGKKLSVASGGTRLHVHKTLQVIGLEGFFPVIVTQEDVAQCKPAPDLFLLAAEKMGAEPKDCLVLEDSQYGMEAAERAGMEAVYIDAEHFSQGPNWTPGRA